MGKMTAKTNYFKIGVFVIAAIFILIAAIIVLSQSALNKDVLILETYIDESVQGLAVGSQVMQRGVQIGRVTKITFVPHEYNMPQGFEAYNKYSRYVMVIMSVDRANFPGLEVHDEETNRVVNQLIDRGLRLKLAYQGITGVAHLEADYVDAKRYPPMLITWQPKYIYIPSAPSMLRNFTQSIDNSFQRLEGIDFEGIFESLAATLNLINETVEQVQIERVREEMLGMASEIRETNKFVQRLMDKSKGAAEGASIPETLIQFNTTLKRMDQFVSGQQSEIEEVVSNIKRASANLRELTEYAKKYPSQVIFGAPPPHSEVVNEK